MKTLETSNKPDTTQHDNRSLEIESGWMTTDEAAVYLRTTAGHLRNLTSNGKVTYYKRGRSNRYLRSDLDNLIKRNKRGYQWD